MIARLVDLLPISFDKFVAVSGTSWPRRPRRSLQRRSRGSAGYSGINFYEGPSEFRQAYARLLMDEVRVTDEEIRISGSKSVLARCAADGVGEPAPRVLSFVREWRARQDSNLWPLPSEGDALSS